jgi:hypothetical protein
MYGKQLGGTIAIVPCGENMRGGGRMAIRPQSRTRSQSQGSFRTPRPALAARGGSRENAVFDALYLVDKFCLTYKQNM